MEPKKISFGFMKTKKPDKPVVTEQREYIESVEQNSIKIIGQELAVEAQPLVIPMKPNTLMTTERLKEIAEKVESAVNEPEQEDTNKNHDETIKQSENETLDQMAARELLQEARNEKKVETENLKITIPSLPVIEGQKESSLEDYESVPIQEFGMAMLRGMGWAPGKETSKYKLPNLRPKGLGLGADKVITENQKKNTPKDNNDKDLEIVTNACVKITFGKYNGFYGKVISLDEDNGRVMVNIPIKKETVNLSEFMMLPVTKSEFDKQSKVLNVDTYEAYKKNENNQKLSENSSKREKGGSSSSHKSKYVDKSDKSEREKSEGNERRDRDRCSQQRDSENHSNGRSREYNRTQDLSSSEEEHRHRRKEKKRYSSADSISSDSDRRRKENKRHGSSDSENNYRRRDKSSSKKKKDIDKKRKGKKKKRDRDRSPGYRKHRK